MNFEELSINVISLQANFSFGLRKAIIFFSLACLSIKNIYNAQLNITYTLITPLDNPTANEDLSGEILVVKASLSTILKYYYVQNSFTSESLFSWW